MKIFLYCIKDGEKIITFGNSETKESKFHHHKNLFFLDVDIDNILISNKIFSGEKNYKNPLLVTRMMTYIKSYDGETKWL